MISSPCVVEIAGVQLNSWKLTSSVLRCYRLSNQTVRNRLHDDGMRARRPVTGTMFSLQNTVQHCGQFTWTPELATSSLEASTLHRWEQVASTNDNDSVRVWRCQGERHVDCNIVEVNGYGRALSWARVCLGGHKRPRAFGRGGLTAVKYHNQILEPIFDQTICRRCWWWLYLNAR